MVNNIATDILTASEQLRRACRNRDKELIKQLATQIQILASQLIKAL